MTRRPDMLTRAEAARIDAARGATPRSAWLRAVALAATEDDHG